MTEIEVELARCLTSTTDQVDVATRVGSILRNRGRLRRSVCRFGAAALAVLGAGAALIVWQLAARALPDFTLAGGADMVLWLPVAIVAALTALALFCVAAAMIRWTM